MPRAKLQTNESLVGPEVVHDTEALLRQIASLIVVRNQNGRRSDKMCLLCKEARRLRIPCPHIQIWALNH